MKITTSPRRAPCHEFIVYPESSSLCPSRVCRLEWIGSIMKRRDGHLTRFISNIQKGRGGPETAPYIYMYNLKKGIGVYDVELS